MGVPILYNCTRSGQICCLRQKASGLYLSKRGIKASWQTCVLLVWTWRHGGHVGGKLTPFFVNSSKKFLVYCPPTWTPCDAVVYKEKAHRDLNLEPGSIFLFCNFVKRLLIPQFYFLCDFLLRLLVLIPYLCLLVVGIEWLHLSGWCSCHRYSGHRFPMPDLCFFEIHSQLSHQLD